NQQDVKVQGVDLVVTLPFDLGGGTSTLTAVANWSDIELSKFNPDFTSDNRRLQIERGRPDTRFVVTWTHLQGPWRFMARGRYYGDYYDAPTNDASVSYYPDPDFLMDFEVSYDIGEQVTLLAGAQNAFDAYPQMNPAGEVAGLIYPESSPFSFNGGFYYLRARWERQ
ncbi:MAG: TonB-dependent receptor, partial [Rhodospirillaceae bacterium]|nr:TonB-dependent receptor [Rhodospirillaceae bacterium]